MKTVLLMVTALSLQAQALTIDEYLGIVVKKNRLFNSYDMSIEAANEKQVAGDLVLAPVLTAGYSVATDKSLPTSLADQRDTTTTSLGVAKKFSTGTAVSLSANTYKYDYTLPVTPGNDGYSKGGVGISLTQSLWKDSFGSGTRLRQSRELLTNRLDTTSIELKKRSTQIEMESDYWDYIVAQEDLKLKQANYDRTKKLESWTSNRVSNGISDDSDLLQVRALAGRRDVELANAVDELKSRETKIRQNMDIGPNENLPELSSDMTIPRPYIAQLSKQSNIIRLDTYLTSLEAGVKAKSSEEVVDNLRPDLSLVGQYATSAYDPVYSEMQKNLTKTDRPVTFVGVNLSWMFGSAKSASINSAKKDALAAQYRADQATLTGRDAWNEFSRKYELAKQNVLTLEKIAKYQSDRSKSEQLKFTKGRTITSNMVNAITDSAEAEVAYLRAKSALRKIEASTLLFTQVSE